VNTVVCFYVHMCVCVYALCMCDFCMILLFSPIEVNTGVCIDVCVYLYIQVFRMILLFSLIQVNTGACVYMWVCVRERVLVHAILVYDSAFLAH